MASDSAPDEQPPVEDEHPAPRSMRPPTKHTNVQRIMLVVNIIVVLACFAAGAALLWAKNQREDFQAAARPLIVTTTGLSTGPVPTDKNGNPLPPETFPEADPKAVNFLVAGSDGKACVDPGSPWANAADPTRPGSERSDTIMVLRIDPDKKQAAALSFPRDLWVSVGGRDTKINSAFVSGDYTKLAQTIYDNFGIYVDEYVQIDFCAFKRIVDAIGGVRVPFEHPVFDRFQGKSTTGLNIAEKGCHQFMGDEALAYVRSRHLWWVDDAGQEHEDPSADLGRISRQQDFLRRMLRAALNKGLFNPGVARGMIDTLQEYVVFSEGFSINDMLKFAGVVADLEPDAVRTYQIAVKPYTVQGQSALLPQLGGENMTAILDIFRGTRAIAVAPQQQLDTATTEAPGSTVPATDTPSAATTTSSPATETATSTAADSGTPESTVFGLVPPNDAQCV